VAEEARIQRDKSRQAAVDAARTAWTAAVELGRLKRRTPPKWANEGRLQRSCRSNCDAGGGHRQSGGQSGGKIARSSEQRIAATTAREWRNPACILKATGLAEIRTLMREPRIVQAEGTTRRLIRSNRHVRTRLGRALAMNLLASLARMATVLWGAGALTASGDAPAGTEINARPVAARQIAQSPVRRFFVAERMTVNRFPRWPALVTKAGAFATLDGFCRARWQCSA